VTRETAACGWALGWAAVVEAAAGEGAAGAAPSEAATKSAGRAESTVAILSGATNASEDATAAGADGLAEVSAESEVAVVRLAESAVVTTGSEVSAAGGWKRRFAVWVLADR